MSVGRRGFVTGSGLGVLAAAAHTARGRLGHDEPVHPDPRHDPHARMPAVPFHGHHQAGVLTAVPPAASFVALDVTAAGRAELRDLLRTLTERARFLTAGGTPRNPGPGAPPPDSGTLGPVVPPDGLTVTVAVGSTLFDDRFGLASHAPRHLKPMTTFPDDDLQPELCGGDLILQICAGASDTALHALRDIAKHTRGGMQVRWRVDGFSAPPRPSGIPRNHLGFKDGIANPDAEDAAVARQLLWAHGSGEPAWAHGGTYHVCRIIKTLVEFWDRVTLTEQQQMIGRYRDSGAPLGMRHEDDVPDYRHDPRGATIPLSAHIRLANPRTTATAHSRIYRRGYNYDRGADENGDLDIGLVFNAFCRNIGRQFEATQRRLVGEPMVDYVSPVGGGYFFTLPGVRDKHDWYARRLLHATSTPRA
ncbi:MAG TPA: Dyp-type peroxidase [Nocardioides sp.]|uniref:Dyp-type peroxidase n=1 Tax=Nocardioides sp. TaxID=35761 RepID=UPI002E34531A|nr:Dyp-type peroxidase [Nocardioides sp.]HEX3929314.1 Dyp-type peroxidase [Nocardioides sp.]